MGKLDSTDNKLENYFCNTLNKYIKKNLELNKVYSTSYSREKNGWNENNKSALRT